MFKYTLRSFLLISAFFITVNAFAEKKLNSNISAMELAEKMECGWNLGNTLDARDNWSAQSKKSPYNEGVKSEADWGEEITTEKIIKAGYASGYKTIRIPVTWKNHLIDTNYTIDSKWMARVKEIVDWSINAGYYVILNEHHSVHDDMHTPLQHCEGYIVRSGDDKESKAFLEAIWKQICATFNNDYDEHLIFETMNEPRNTAHEHCWNPQPETCKECKEDVRLLKEYNQLILDTIRASGGNNKNRFVMIPAMGTSIAHALAASFSMPKDSAKDKLLLTVHLYPLDSGGTGKGSHHFDPATKNSITSNVKALAASFTSKGIPVVFGEVGAARNAGTEWVNGKEKKITGYVVTYEDRLNCFTLFARQTGKYSMPLINWDCGGEYGMATIDRKKCTAVEPEYNKAVIDAWTSANKNPKSASEELSDEDFSVSYFKVWNETTSSFNKETGLMKLGKNYQGGDIWFGVKDIANYPKLKITYSDSTADLLVWVSYTDDSEEEKITLKASKKTNTATIKLNTKKQLKQLLFMSTDKEASIKIEKISFLVK